jgi:hypothetical protein
MSDKQTSPLITNDAWGRLEVENLGTLKDAKLWPGGGREWNWKETGTDHKPGIQVADVEELVQNGADVVILSRGRTGILGVTNETLSWLEERGVEIEVLRTPKAIEEYNRLAGKRNVGALIHSTC